MSLLGGRGLGGRGGRSDDWSTPHLRARARAAERVDGPIDPAEEAWLDEHLAGCPACSAAAADYASQRLELRALRDRPPLPPRDLWARTAAAIEREAGTHDRRRPTSLASRLGPYALLTGAVIVAVAVGSLSLSQNPGPTATDVASGTPPVVTGPPTQAAATPLLVGPGSVAYLTRGDGDLQFRHLEFTHVCGPATKGCETSSPADSQSLGPVPSPETVFGAAGGDRPLVVLSNGNGSGGRVYAVVVATDKPEVTPTPTPTTTVPPAASSTPPPATASPSTSPTDSASASPGGGSPSPSSSALPSAVVEIARDLKVLDTTAAYAPDGSAFAFTARPADGSHGPDIYLWHVGAAEAQPITTDHRSVFGSWAHDSIVGSTVAADEDGRFVRPVAFILRPGTTEAAILPQVGLAWRPVVDPTGRTAVYWSGRLAATEDGLDWNAHDGRLVVGRWDDITETVLPPAAASPDASASAGPDASAAATPSPLADADQQSARSETTIAPGPLAEWDARWAESGTRLAVWIADPNNPTIGRLSLYVVDPFNGKIDQSKPPLLDEPALAGFAIADGHLAWAAPPAAGSSESSVLVLAWTGNDFGQVESAPGDVILVR
jgi:hypothetical protein